MDIHTHMDQQWSPHSRHEINDDREAGFILPTKQIYQLTRTTRAEGQSLPFVRYWGELHHV